MVWLFVYLVLVRVLVLVILLLVAVAGSPPIHHGIAQCQCAEPNTHTARHHQSHENTSICPHRYLQVLQYSATTVVVLRKVR
jgi:hypothetical protein